MLVIIIQCRKLETKKFYDLELRQKRARCGGLNVYGKYPTRVSEDALVILTGVFVVFLSTYSRVNAEIVA